MKKIISLLLVCILIVSVVPIGSAAAFKKEPFAKTTVFVGSNPVSRLELERYFADTDEDFELSMSGVTYNYKVEVSSGETIALTNRDSFVKVNNDYILAVKSYIKKSDFENAQSRVPIRTCSAVVKKSINSLTDLYKVLNDKSYNAATFETDAPLIDRYVREIKAVSGVPSKIYEGADYLNLKKAKFEVTYYDGTTQTFGVETYKPVKISNDLENAIARIGYVSYRMNGADFNCAINESEGIAEFSYIDAPLLVTDIEVRPTIFSDIKIVDYDFNGVLKSVTYSVTKTDGTSEEFFYEIDNENKPYGVIDKMNGYYVLLGEFGFNYEENTIYTGGDDESVYKLSVRLGQLSDSVEIERPQSRNFLQRILDFFRQIFARIRNLFK